jgi:hypothetical protein
VKLRPWPSRAQRKADVAWAQGEADKSRQSAAEAARIEADLRRMAADNHFAALVQAAITGRERTDGGENGNA